MSAMEVALLVGFVASGVALVGIAIYGPRRWEPRLTKRKVIVHTARSTAYSSWPRLMGSCCAAATYLDDDARPELAGEIFIPRSKVSFVQDPGSPMTSRL